MDPILCGALIMAQYKLCKDSSGTSTVAVNKYSDGVALNTQAEISIPWEADGNTDWEEYKLWVAAGNTPEAAD